MQPLTETIVRDKILAEGAYVNLAVIAAQLSVTRSVLWDFIRVRPELSELITANRQEFADRANANLRKAVNQGQAGAAGFALNTSANATRDDQNTKPKPSAEQPDLPKLINDENTGALASSMQPLSETIVRDKILAEDAYVNLAAIASQLGVTRTILWDFIRVRPELSELITANRQEFADRAHANLRKGVKQGRAWAICLALNATANDDRDDQSKKPKPSPEQADLLKSINEELARREQATRTCEPTTEAPPPEPLPVLDPVQQLDRAGESVLNTLADCAGNLSGAAKKLGVTREQLTDFLTRRPELQAGLAARRKESNGQTEAKLRAALDTEKPWAIRLVLKALGPSRGYSKVPRKRGKKPKGLVPPAPVGMLDLSRLTHDERAEYEQLQAIGCGLQDQQPDINRSPAGPARDEPSGQVTGATSVHQKDCKLPIANCQLTIGGMDPIATLPTGNCQLLTGNWQSFDGLAIAPEPAAPARDERSERPNERMSVQCAADSSGQSQNIVPSTLPTPVGVRDLSRLTPDERAEYEHLQAIATGKVETKSDEQTASVEGAPEPMERLARLIAESMEICDMEDPKIRVRAITRMKLLESTEEVRGSEGSSKDGSEPSASGSTSDAKSNILGMNDKKLDQPAATTERPNPFDSLWEKFSHKRFGPRTGRLR